MSKLSAGAIAIQRAEDEKLELYEVVVCIPSLGKFATIPRQRKRFGERKHAQAYTHVSGKERGFHFAILFGTRAEVAAQCIPYNELDEMTDDMAVPSEYKFGIVLVDPTTDKKVTDNINGDFMRFTTKELADRALAFLNQHCQIGEYTRNVVMRVVPVVGMDDVEMKKIPFKNPLASLGAK